MGFWSAVGWFIRKERVPASLTVRQMLPLVIFNQWVVTPVMIGSLLWINGVPPVENTWWELGSNLLLRYPAAIIILNAGFAISHYGFHRNKWLYRNVHAIHHRLWVPHPMGSIYAHPLEHVVANLGPVGLGIILTGLGWWSSILFVLQVSYETVKGHTRLKRNVLASNHNLHHAKVTCNYDNSPYLFDRLIGTYRSLEEVQ